MLSTNRSVSSLSTAFDYHELRGELSKRMIMQTSLAEASGLSKGFVWRLMCGGQVPGELARIKLERGMKALNIDPAVAFGPSEQQSSSAETE